MDKKTLVTNFKEITSTQDLIAYLSDSINRLDNTKNKSVQYVYHYTKLSNVVSIIKSRFWWLKSPKTMNDGLEFQNISEFEQSNAVFFASFMYDSSESIAMWSMYAQPWEDGVFIRIPVAIFKKWIRNTETIYTVLCPKNQKPIIEKSPIPNKDLSIVRVAYTNSDSVQDKSDEILICGKAENNLLKNTPHLPDLVGYITISPGKSTPSQQEPAANSTAFCACLNWWMTSCECRHTTINGKDKCSFNWL